VLGPDEAIFIGKSDVSIAPSPAKLPEPLPTAYGVATPVWVEVPVADEVNETFVALHDVVSGTRVPLIELLSPANKLGKSGRE